MEQPYMLPILYCQYHACWCPGDLSRQGISRHGIDSRVPHPMQPILVAAAASHLLWGLERQVDRFIAEEWQCHQSRGHERATKVSPEHSTNHNTRSPYTEWWLPPPCRGSLAASPRWGHAPRTRRTSSSRGWQTWLMLRFIAYLQTVITGRDNLVLWFIRDTSMIKLSH